jgi:hypothetical protein
VEERIWNKRPDGLLEMPAPEKAGEFVILEFKTQRQCSDRLLPSGPMHPIITSLQLLNFKGCGEIFRENNFSSIKIVFPRTLKKIRTLADLH